ncbi:transporter substrate-binding protein (plasmid) [Pseudomonas silvicola]|nr:transporter substrate-binding protein [Pseudomonas silvicola]
MVSAGGRGAHLILPPMACGRHERQIPIASTVFGGGNEHHSVAEESNGILVAANYMQEIPSAENKAFVDKFHARYGDMYISDLAMGAYPGHVDLG